MALAKKDKAKKPVKVEKVRYGLNLGEMVRTAVDTPPYQKNYPLLTGSIPKNA